ncbi:MAG TPA: amidohydrolase family protein [Micropepsaceae bacterium]|jgi:aminocarboxymuconate-semialdehyde decarboxylase|nr:amidohydrolase family protein [Micropepsaceae bacterium]
MRIIDSHFHWWPRSAFERLCKRTTYPLCERNSRSGYNYVGHEGRPSLNSWAEWFDLDRQFEHMDGLGHQVSVVSSLGPFSISFSDLAPDEGRDAALNWNEEMAAAQRKYRGRFWGTAAIPLTDTDVAIEVLDHAILKLGLVGVNIPGSIGRDTRIDAERLMPFYARIEQLGIPLFLHPTDAVFGDDLEGYGGALQLSLGRVIEVSVSASRLIFSGLMERFPNLKIVMSHTGGALPYQSGRMDKNGKNAKLPRPPSTYIHRMYTDTVSPHSLGMKFAIDYYGIDQVMYGSDYPCWDPATALALIDELELSDMDREKLFVGNARRFFGLADFVTPGVQQSSLAGALV